MTIVLELNGFLDEYLPDDAAHEIATVSVEPGATPASMIESLGIPPHRVLLVHVGGHLLARERWGTRRLVEGDVLSMWPVLAGG